MESGFVAMLAMLIIAALMVIPVIVKRHWYVQSCLLLVESIGLVCALSGINGWFSTGSASAVGLAGVGVVALIAGLIVVTWGMRMNKPE